MAEQNKEKERCSGSYRSYSLEFIWRFLETKSKIHKDQTGEPLSKEELKMKGDGCCGCPGL